MRRLLTLAAVIVLASTAPTLADHVMSPIAAREAALARAVTVDIRLPVEWAETGLPAGAAGVPLQNPLTAAVRPDFVDDLLAVVGAPVATPVGCLRWPEVRI